MSLDDATIVFESDLGTFVVRRYEGTLQLLGTNSHFYDLSKPLVLAPLSTQPETIEVTSWPNFSGIRFHSPGLTVGIWQDVMGTIITRPDDRMYERRGYYRDFVAYDLIDYNDRCGVHLFLQEPDLVKPNSERRHEALRNRAKLLLDSTVPA